MDWFEKITGFKESSYEETQGRLEINGTSLHSRINGKSYGIGKLELVSLQALRERVILEENPPDQIKVSMVTGDVLRMHQKPENSGALFQVASQFNLLEMISPKVTPEDGVTRYQNDHTQGPACAVAAGAATIYRNYFVPVKGIQGQTAKRQLDGLAGLGEVLSADLCLPIDRLWKMKNGYSLCTKTGLDTIATYMETLKAEEIDALRGKVSVGVHSDVEVTEAEGPNPLLVSQVFCSALPISYFHLPHANCRPFAFLILEAAYEATMWAALFNSQRGKSNVVFLTFLGGGAFGNHVDWIHSAIRRALILFKPFNLDVRLVSYKAPSKEASEIVKEF